MKFKYLDEVKVVNGFFKGHTGKCIHIHFKNNIDPCTTDPLEYVVELRDGTICTISEGDLKEYV